MKIYLAGPMTGWADLNFPAFDEAAMQLRLAGHEVFNPAETNFGKPSEDVTRREALTVDLAWICEHAEALALLPGWRGSRGAQAEFATALAIGIDTGDVEAFL
jgi:hypothetical protein